MEYEIVISHKTSKDLVAVISKYWSFKDEGFVYSIENINKELSRLKYTQSTILDKSHCILHFSNCTLCFSSYEKIVTSRKEFLNEVNSQERVCNPCQSYSPKYLEGVSTIFPTQESIDELSDLEYRVLIGIIQLRDKMLIYKHIFNNDLENQEIWKIINMLQKKRIIWIERTNDYKIKSFKFSEKIPELIKNTQRN
ncbi:hypothetical protein [uncultured Aquimarina sp.]|uniref:hypothetical protein n=1 Tax=uncultured Aquimarina sp. TaxID=575652 RepID=UPI002624AA4C|nr:hypothetical protein [uncultured Aquimarina sp.]